MGNNQNSENLSPALKDKLLKIFRKFDTDGSKTIDKEETLKYWKTNFAKLNTDALFKAVDVDNSGTIEEDEWIEFWREVKRAGHSEKEIEEEDLSPELEQRILSIFNKFDADGSKSIDKAESAQYWKENGAANSEALFNSVDVDGSGTLEVDEWVNYFKVVKGAGYGDDEIGSQV